TTVVTGVNRRLHDTTFISRREHRAPSLRCIYGLQHRFADFCRWPGHEYGFRAIRPGLAHDVRLEHVHLPCLKMGRWNPLRTWSPPARIISWILNGNSHDLDLVQRIAKVGPLAFSGRFGDSDYAGNPGRPDGPFPVTPCGFNCACLPGADV